MNFIKKRVDSFTIKKFYPTKEYSILLSETSSYNIAVKSASFCPLSNLGSFSGSNHFYYLINQLFYKKNKSPYYYSSRDIDNGFFKQLTEESRVIFIPKNLFGEKIKPFSFQLSASSNTILISDNGYGQLIDNSATNVVTASNLVGWWTFDDGYSRENVKKNYTSLNLRKTSEDVYIQNGTFTTGVQNYRNCISFDGDGYARIKEYKDIDLEKTDNFSISFWLNVPVSQSVTSSTLNTVISKGYAQDKKYFFKIDLYNQTDGTNVGKLKAYRSDMSGQSSITSTALTSGQFNHVVFQKSASVLQLYVNNSLVSSVADSTNSDVYFKRHIDDIYIGGYIQSSSFDVVTELSGSVDEMRFYNTYLSTAEISNLYNYPYNTNIVGNVYYEHGIAVITNLSGSYSNVYNSSTDTMKYKSVVQVREIKTELTKNPGEFNFSLNPSLFTRASYEDKTLIPMVSSSFSLFSPYITTIGLMNKKGETVAVAKLKRPLKSNLDLPIKFVIRIDI